MTGDDPLDRALGDALRGLAGPSDDTDPVSALEAVRPRALRARRQRQARITGVAAAFVAVVITGSFLLDPADNGEITTPATQPVDGSTSMLSTPSSTRSESGLTPTTTTGSTTPDGTPTTRGGATPGTTPSSTPGVTGESTPGSTPGTARGATPGTTPSTTPTTTPSSTPTTAPPDVDPTTYTNPGGTVVARVTDGELVLVSVNPAAGYSIEEQDVEPDRIRVRFVGPSDEDHRLELRLRDGVVVIDRND